MGSHRSQPDLKKWTTTKQTKTLDYGVSHMCGWRMYMEDAHISQVPFSTKQNTSLFGVFDGHGGAEVAVFVERHFAEELQRNPKFGSGDYEAALKQTFMKMDVMLLSESGKKQISAIQNQMKQKQNGSKIEQESHAGCTANVCLITPTHIYVANAGDSRSVASVSGKCQQLSRDHKPENEQQLKRIQDAGGSVTWGRVNGNLNLSRALGDLQYKTNAKISPQSQMITAYPDVMTLERGEDKVDFIIMGCDGIWQSKSNQDMVKWVQKRINDTKDLGKILQELLDELIAKDNGGEYGMDNMSAILIKFNK